MCQYSVKNTLWWSVWIVGLFGLQENYTENDIYKISKDNDLRKYQGIVNFLIEELEKIKSYFETGKNVSDEVINLNKVKPKSNSRKIVEKSKMAWTSHSVELLKFRLKKSWRIDYSGSI